jgi:hypothetical protein
MRTGLWALALVFSEVIAASSVAEAQVGGWVSANAVAAKPAALTTTQTTSFPCCSPLFTGIAQSTFEYKTATKVSVDVGGGVLLFSKLGVGVALSRYSDEHPAVISFSRPHPLFVGRPASASGTSQSGLTQEETVIHIEARYVGNLPHASVAVFAGPSYFKTTRNVVDNYRFLENLGSSTLNYTVSLVDNTTKSHDLSAWGFNVGVDAGYYFGENVGVGMLVRYSNAKVNLPDDFKSLVTGTPATQSLDLGGVAVGGGLRLRF